MIQAADSRYPYTSRSMRNVGLVVANRIESGNELGVLVAG